MGSGLILRRHAALFGAAAFLLFLGWGSAPGAESLLRVHLTHGRTLDVLDCRIENGQATLALPGGGTISVPASLVDRIEDVAPGPVQPAQPPAPEAVREAPDPSPPELPSGRDVPADTLDSLIRSAARRHRIEPELLAAVIAVESGYQAGAVSPRGAQGLMQLMPGTAKDLAVTDPFDPRQNIEAGAMYLRQLLDQHGDSYVKALAAYNAGMGRVARYNGLPPYRETVAYIGRVLKRYQHPQPPPDNPPSLR